MGIRKVRNSKLYLTDILEAIEHIQRYLRGLSFQEFSNDQLRIDAVVRNFEIIGEAARQLPAEIRNKYPHVEWKSIIAFRNIIIHEYFGIDKEIMWDIIKNKIPSLKTQIKPILKKLE